MYFGALITFINSKTYENMHKMLKVDNHIPVSGFIDSDKACQSFGQTENQLFFVHFLCSAN